MPADEIRAYWPGTLDHVSRHGVNGRLAALLTLTLTLALTRTLTLSPRPTAKP